MSSKPKTAKSRTSNLSTGLVGRLREDILAETIIPGEKLTEKDICVKYNVSRTPVREALKNLETEGLIELIPNRGAFVIGFSIGDMKDLLELRKGYEVQAVKWAIQRIYEDELLTLEECFDYMQFYTEKKDIRKLRDINDNFHKIIYEATHNRVVINILSLYNYYIKHSKITSSTSKDDLLNIFNEHARIFNAFLMQDVNAGATAMEDHIVNSTSRYLTEVQ